MDNHGIGEGQVGILVRPMERGVMMLWQECAGGELVGLLLVGGSI